MKTGAELRNAKLRVGKVEAEVGKMEAEVGKMEAEVRVRDERVGKMEAEVRERETRLEMAKRALASSNTELLRYKRKCVPVWMGRPTHGLAPCLTSLTSPTLSCTYTYLPFTDQLTVRNVIELVERTLSPKKARQPSLSRGDTWLDIFELDPDLEAQVRAICGAKDTTGAVRAFQDLYEKLSNEIHNPDAVDVKLFVQVLEGPHGARGVLSPTDSANLRL
jgi:hypothetical protein